MKVSGFVGVHRFRSGAEEAAFIAHQFRSAHLRQGVSYSDMAVILRSPGVQAAALRRAFSREWEFQLHLSFKR
jgi:ATP-dependent exoDNAse (exonuclease V) beta subunit